MIKYSKQYIDKSDINSVLSVLKSDYLTQGPLVIKFEDSVSKKIKSKYSVAVNSATSALHISCLALGLGNGDVLWTVPNTFVASANCGLYCGANIDFIDIDIKTFNICFNELEKKLINAKKNKKLPKIIVPVDFGGNPYDHIKLKKLSKKYKFKILEDASHAFGAKINNKYISPSLGSDIVVFSFHPVKPFTTAEGGLASTNNKKLYEKLKQLRSHGIIKDKKKLINKKNSDWYYEQRELGFNYRMNELQAALGVSQLKKIDKFTFKRNQNANYYLKKLSNKDLTFQEVKKNNTNSYHLFIVLFPNKKKILNNYDKIFREFLKNKISVMLHYRPIHLHPFFKKKGFKDKDYPVSENYAKRAFSIPNFFLLNKIKQDKVISTINKILKKFS